jgi:hypothetical protein
VVAAAIAGASLVARTSRAEAGAGLEARARAEQWLVEFGQGQVLTDDQTRATLVAADHWDPARLPAVDFCGRIRCRPTWVLATPALRKESASVPPVRASTPVAIFGAGDQRVEIRRPTSETPDELVTAARARVAVGQALVDTGRIVAATPVRSLLTDGRADPRILATLATLVQRGPARVIDLPAAAGEDAADQPRRQLVLAVPADQVAEVRDFFAAQQDPYRPTVVIASPTGFRVAYPPVAPPLLLQGLAGP